MSFQLNFVIIGWVRFDNLNSFTKVILFTVVNTDTNCNMWNIKLNQPEHTFYFSRYTDKQIGILCDDAYIFYNNSGFNI